MRLVLVSPSRGNRYMLEILEAIAFEARGLGVEAEVVHDRFPEEDDAVYVVIPHEYFALAPRSAWPATEQLARTFALTVEHPGTQWFDTSAEQARRCAAIIDINLDSSAELRRRGRDVLHFQLGYTEYSDVWRGGDGAPEQRGTDILYLGSTDQKRDRALAGAAPFWWDRSVKLLIPSHEPKPDGSADFIVGAEKFALLRDSKVLVNLHRDRSRSLEWVRVLEAIANGCVVYSEHSLDAAPLIAQEHFVSVSPENIGIMTANVLDNADELDRIRRTAYDFVRSELRLRSAVERLLEAAEQLLRAPRPVPEADEVALLPDYLEPEPEWRRFSGEPDHVGDAIARLESRVTALLRAVSASSRPSVAPLVTPAWGAAAPRVSVIVPMYNGGPWIRECLDSAIASAGIAFEVVIMDDGSTDDSPALVAAYLAEHPGIPMRLVSAPGNRGLAATRNALLREARGEYVFSLDADNGVYPTALRTLAALLDADQGATFAYCILAAVTAGEPQGLVSSRPWNPRLFRYGNYIDNMSMLRRQEIIDAGGWDTTVPNWEDFHLWVRLAEAGKRAAFAPEMLAWYRLQPDSMRMEVVLHQSRIWTKLRADAPTVLGDEAAAR
ncbi:glycosyltransferase family 2 protein [Microbacteriaceae bacterium VKM Ac-2854]|nr:glycosyltransferase family 2 protein [Microbacteriaceae bacterium VKM Ac-2854]